MRRKLGFGMAMLHEPPLLVLDEPSTGVDPVSRVDLWRMVSEAAAAGAAVLMSTTYLDEAERARYAARARRGAACSPRAPSTRCGPRSPVGREPPRTGAVRPQWSWRRGRMRRGVLAAGRAARRRGRVVEPDLEDVVVALSLPRRTRAVAR